MPLEPEGRKPRTAMHRQAPSKREFSSSKCWSTGSKLRAYGLHASEKFFKVKKGHCKSVLTFMAWCTVTNLSQAAFLHVSKGDPPLRQAWYNLPSHR